MRRAVQQQASRKRGSDMTAVISDPSPGARGKSPHRVRSDGDRASEHLREVFAGSRSAQHELQATTAALTPLHDGSVPQVHRIWVAAAFLLGVISRDALGDLDAVGSALERALDLAEADQVLLPLLASPASGWPQLQDRHPAAPAASISQVVDLLAQANGLAAPPGEPALPRKALTRSEVRVLRYLPTNLSTREVAAELYLSMNTVKTHQRHLYQKLGASSRTEAVEQARALGLLAPAHRVARGPG
jgi:LuxR family transcriptional regulator, maltose regulon positive regulatory protein